MSFRDFYLRLRLSRKISSPFFALFLCMSLLGTSVFGYWLSMSLEETTKGKVEGLAALVLRSAQEEERRLRSESRLIADGDQLRDAVARHDTVALTKILLPAKVKMGLSLVKVVDAGGRELLDLRDQRLVGARLGDEEALSQVLAGMYLGNLVSAEAKAATLMVGVAPVKSGDGLYGGVILGLAVDNDLAQQLNSGSGEHLVVFNGPDIVATTLKAARSVSWSPPASGSPPTRITIDGAQYLAKRVDLALTGSKSGLAIVVLGSVGALDEANRLLWIRLSAFFLTGILIVAMIGSRVAAAITGPLEVLTRASEDLAGGNLEARAGIACQDEVGELSAAFNAMAQQLQERNQSLSGALEELERSQEDLVALNLVATQLAQFTQSSDVLSMGLQQAVEATGLQAGAIWLLKTEGAVELVSEYRMPSGIRDLLHRLPTSESTLWTKVLAGQPQLVCHSEPDVCSVQANSEKVALEQGVLAPLVARGTVTGVIALCGQAGRVCDKKELNVVQAIGASIGLALDNARRYEQLRFLADHDPVTGLFNHRAFHQRLDQETRRAQRAFSHVSVIMMDLNNFKLFNDTYGHPMGDRILREIAATLKETARTTDVLGRYGGDEFVALLPDTGAEGSLIFAERLRAAVALRPFVTQDGTAVPIEMSFGLATYPEDAQSSHELVSCADVNLYTSKRRGGEVVATGQEIEKDVANIGAFGVMDGLVTAVDNKDQYTKRHSEEVTNYALSIAAELGLSEENLRTLRIAGLLHDVGKIGVPDRILRKPGKLSDGEFKVISQHALLGEMIIKEVPNLTDVLAAVGAHHERLDGRGYPRGLRGDEIPLLGRILAVADTYSAMTSDRPYRKALTPEKAREELLRVSGSQLDPGLVSLLLKQLERKRDLAEVAVGD